MLSIQGSQVRDENPTLRNAITKPDGKERLDITAHLLKTITDNSTTEDLEVAIEGQALLFCQIAGSDPSVFKYTSASVKTFLNEWMQDQAAFDEGIKVLGKLAAAYQNRWAGNVGFYQESGTSTISTYDVTKLSLDIPLFVDEDTSAARGTLSANLSASLYQKPIAASHESKFRDAALALSYEQKFGRSPFVTSGDDQTPITINAGASYERLKENEHQGGKKADLGVIHFGMKIPFTAAVAFPISATYVTHSSLQSQKCGEQVARKLRSYF